MSYFKLNKIYFKLYLEFLPTFFTTSLLFGGLSGVSSMCDSKNPFDVFTNLTGYLSIGAITGITFPISYPLLGGYVLYKHVKKNKEIK